MPLLEVGFDAYVRGVALARQEQLREVAKAMASLHSQLGYMPRYRVNWVQVRQGTAPMRSFMVDTVKVLRTIGPLAYDRDLVDGVREMAQRVQKMLDDLDRFTR